METVRDTVYNHLKAIHPLSATNNEIAHQTGIAEPSVRRATLRLESATRIFYDGTAGFGRGLWKASL